MWCPGREKEEGKWLTKTSRKSVSQSVFCGISTCCVLNTVPPIDDHGNSNSHVQIFSPKKLLECRNCNRLISSNRASPLSDKFAKCCLYFLY
uniref:Uncharacterized protein n=1 Tax=Balaenoptera musculus TaxID=9771 RepID=A0A8C0I2K9_BALMU